MDIVVNRRYIYPYTTATYNESIKTVGDINNILRGRMIEWAKRSLGVFPESRAERRLVFPVSLIRRFVLFFNRVGWYDSVRNMKELMVTTPD